MMKRLLLMFIGAMMGIAMNAQNISGTVVDGGSGDPIIGATVMIKGSSIGTITDVDGKFSINNTLTGTRQLEIGFLGFQTMLMSIGSDSGDLGTISLGQGIEGLEEVVVTGTMDIVRDRRTPVAVSTITAAEIQRKAVGNVELGEVAKATPSIFIANQAGGYGDSEVWTRGFDQTNTAFLLNGQPINGMEDGKMYWSNWSGLTDVASAVQIQRGLGASKLAISSVGGTWNFIMKATDNVKGGNVFTTIGNDNYQKMGVSYSTGLINDKFGITALLSTWSGDGWAHGTKGQGQTYFLSAGYKPNANHTINFLVTGAPQWHDQKFQTSIKNHTDSNGDIDPRYNGNWGNYDGRYFSERRNYYHKPVMNLNWDWTLDEKSKFSTVFYGSLGRGGGTGGLGEAFISNSSGLKDFDALADQNRADPDGIANSGDYLIEEDRDGNPADGNYIRRASVNSHNWFGVVAKYERKLMDNLNLSIGTDLRRYYGDHYRQVVNLMGTKGYQQGGVSAYPNGYIATKEYSANPWSALFDPAPKGDRIAYNNAETIKYGGVFGQLEYFQDKFSAYLQGSVSSQNHVRHELFYATDDKKDSEKVVNNGYNAKLGLSYAINDNHSVFANTGVYSRQPFHDAVFVGNSNVVNEFTSNEQIVGLEAGYKYTSSVLSANINFYRTSWNNRVDFNSLQAQDDGTVILTNNEVYTPIGADPYELLFQDQLHSGIELDLGLRVTKDLNIKGFGSLGDWQVIGDRDVQLFDGVDARNKVRDFVASGDNIKVGGAPQTSFGLGARYDFTKNFDAEVNWFNYSRLYARNGGIELPSYSTVDLNLGYTIPMDSGSLFRIGANIYNIFNELYISKSRSSIAPDADTNNNWKGVNKNNQVAFGKTRTWNVSLKYSF